MDSATPGNATKPIPSVLAMLLCDTVITDGATGRKTLVNLFEDFTTGSDFPQVVGQAFALFAKVTDMEGRYATRIDLVSLEDEQRIASYTADIQSPGDRFATYEWVVRFPPQAARFERPGRYEFQLYADDVLIGRCTVHVGRRKGSK